MKLYEYIESPLRTKNLFLKYIEEINSLNSYKENITAETLAFNYAIINKNFLRIRETIKRAILSDDRVYNLHCNFASNDILYDIMIDGWSYDINKALDNDPLMCFMPYEEQLLIIDSIQRDDLYIHLEKGRRMGASKLFVHVMKHFLRFGKNEVMYATHKDLESLDMMRGDSGHNSTFDNIRWLLDKSIWVNPKWRDGEDGGYTQQKQINLMGNVLKGAVLGKGTAVGMAGTRIFVDEFDVVCDMFPNQANQMLGAFSQSVNRIYIYSTYRSMMYPFYKLKVDKAAGWTFLTLDWHRNPTCNTDWYDKARAKMGNDPILTARELDRDPTKVRKGVIFAEEVSIVNYYEGYNSIPNKEKLKKVTGADFGGGSSLTSFALGYLDTSKGILYIDDMVESTKLDEYGVASQLALKGFKEVPAYSDNSAFSQIGAKGHDWNTLLRLVGVHLIPVSNQSIYVTHALMRVALKDGLIKLNKKNSTLLQRFLLYSYKEDKVLKDVNSHFGDACSYLFKGLFQKIERGVL